MKYLKRGDVSNDVKILQEALTKISFPVGNIDGIFGEETELGLKAFQKSEGIEPDGIYGAITNKVLSTRHSHNFTNNFLEHLKVSNETVAKIDDREHFTEPLLRKMLPSAPLFNIRTHAPIVMDKMYERDLGDKHMLSIAFATIAAETARLEPISEYVSKYNTSPNGHPFDRYDFRKDLGNGANGDGAKYKGRGFIQLTGKYNYGNQGNLIGEDLINNPELANKPIIAAKILASYIHEVAKPIRKALKENDLKAVRRLVNGGLHGYDRFRKAYFKSMG